MPPPYHTALNTGICVNTSPLIIIATSLLLGSLLNLSACQRDEKPDEKSRDNSSKFSNSDAPTHDHSQHPHGDIEVSSFGEDTAIPSVNFTIESDSASGWNINIHTEHFRFAPEKVNTDASPGEGHAHLYIDGKKIARLYGHWYHLKKLTPGEHDVRIGLNANDHSIWNHQGRAITATQTIIQR